jgi:hypothetical protein
MKTDNNKRNRQTKNPQINQQEKMNKQPNEEIKTKNKTKQANKKGKNDMFRNNRISVFILVLELLLWHPVLILA